MPAAPTVPMHVENRDGRATIVADQDLPTVPDHVVRDVLDSDPTLIAAEWSVLVPASRLVAT